MALTTIRTQSGKFTGKEPDTIVRREYGQTARILWNEDKKIAVTLPNGQKVIVDQIISIY